MQCALVVRILEAGQVEQCVHEPVTLDQELRIGPAHMHQQCAISVCLHFVLRVEEADEPRLLYDRRVSVIVCQDLL